MSQHGSLAAMGSWVVTRVFCFYRSFGTSVVRQRSFVAIENSLS